MLLPSAELKKLHETVPICLSMKELPANCDIRYGQFYYFFMFNELGELTDVANMSQGLTMGKRRSMSLPEAFLDMVDESLKIKTSLASCEREYLDSKGAAKSYKNLKKKLKQLEQIGSMRVVHFLREHADQMADPTLTRFRAISLEAAAVGKQVIEKKAFDALRSSIEVFLIENSDHPEIGKVLENYFNVALRYSFDVPKRCNELAASWRKGAGDENRAATMILADQLIEYCDRHTKSVQGEIKDLDNRNSYEAPRLYAQIGDAEKTLESLEKSQTFGVFRPIHKAWREQAAESLAKKK